MLESILKTTQSDSEEHNALLKALKVMHGVAISLNSKKSIMEAERKTRLFMNRIESDWVNVSSVAMMITMIHSSRRLHPSDFMGYWDHVF